MFDDGESVVEDALLRAVAQHLLHLMMIEHSDNDDDGDDDDDDEICSTSFHSSTVSIPLMATEPLEGSNMPVIMPIVVLLPAPLCPSRAVIEPSSKVALSPLRESSTLL